MDGDGRELFGLDHGDDREIHMCGATGASPERNLVQPCRDLRRLHLLDPCPQTLDPIAHVEIAELAADCAVLGELEDQLRGGIPDEDRRPAAPAGP